MPKWRVTEVMCQTDRFHQVFISSQGSGDRTTNLRDFQSVGETSAIVVPFIVDEDLGFVFQASKGSRMNDAITIPLEGNPVIGFFIWKGPAF